MRSTAAAVGIASVPAVSSPRPAARFCSGRCSTASPKSIVIGISLLEGGSVGLAFVVAVFISNLPEGLSGATGMRKAGHSPRAIFALWAIVCAASALAAGLGYALAGDVPDHAIGVVQAFAAGGILTMLADTMMPEAFDEGGHRPWVGLVTVLGFGLGSWLQVVA